MAPTKFILSLASAFLMALEVRALEASQRVEVNVEDFEMRTFDSRIDHFSVLDRRTFKQRYWVNDRHWQAGDGAGPNLLYLCGEYACSIND